MENGLLLLFMLISELLLKQKFFIVKIHITELSIFVEVRLEIKINLVKYQ